MSVGRKQGASVGAVAVKVNEEAVRRATDAADTVALADQQVMASAPLFMLVGRMQQAMFTATVSDVSAAKSYLQARDIFKKINNLPFTGPDGSVRNVSDFDEFCRLAFGKGERRLQQISAAINTLGEDLYEAAQVVGFKARDYQALNALPSDAQEKVKLALASGDKETAVDLVYELAQRLQAANAEAEELAKSGAAKDRVIESKNKKIDKMTEAEELRRSAPLPEQEAAQLDTLRDDTLAAESALQRLLATVDETMQSPATAAAETAARHSLDYLVQRIVDGCLERGITVDLAERVAPLWSQPIEAAASGRRGKKAN